MHNNTSDAEQEEFSPLLLMAAVCAMVGSIVLILALPQHRRNVLRQRR